MSYAFQICPKCIAKMQISAVRIGENYFSVGKYYNSELESEVSVQKKKKKKKK